MLSGPTAAYDVAAALRDALATALAAVPGGVPDRVCVVGGDIAWDDCECGILAVTVEDTFPCFDFPAEANVIVGGCDPPLVGVDLLVQVVRCAPPIPDTANAPSCAALDAGAQSLLQDAHAVSTTTACTLSGLEQSGQIVDWLVRRTVIVGPMGGCVGVQTRATVGVNYSR